MDKELDDLLLKLRKENSLNEVNFDNDLQEDFEFARHTNTGYNNHNNTGCNTHSNSTYNNHTNNGCDNSSGCNTHSDTGCNTHSDYGGGSHSDYGYDDAYYYDSYSDYSTYVYQDSGCNQGSCSDCYNYTAHSQANGCIDRSGGCYDHYNSGCNDHYDSGYDDHYDSGYDDRYYCSDHSNSGCSQCSNSGYNDHSNTGSNTHSNYTDNNPPTLSGVVTPGDGTFNASISFTWPVASDSLIPGQPPETKFTYNLHYRHKASGASSYGSWEFAGTTQTNSFVWNTTSIPNGTVEVAVFAFDGIEWSGGIEGGNLTGSYLKTGELKIVHYQAPAWTNVITANQSIIHKIDHDELRREINKARQSFGLPTTGFTNGETWPEKSHVTVHITEMRTAANEASVAAGKPEKTFSQPNIVKDITVIKANDTLELRQILEDLD